MAKLSTLLCGAACLLASYRAEAFCGFYVGGGGSEIFNNATQVVLMREGTLTILSMQNNYQGPADNFAMVIPVPVILKKENVKTLPKEVFGKVDQLGAPRLVEYWEQNPCPEPYPAYPGVVLEAATGMSPRSDPTTSEKDKKYGVKIEAQFTVGEYEIVILSAKDSTGLDTWLRDNKYNIPKGADTVLKPYIESGMKFFVAKVDVKKVTFNAEKQAMLSPLRFQYDSENFALPVRLGLLNSNGTQDMIVSIFAQDRYEVSNYKNVTIPTNLDVVEGVKEEFGPWYAALFDKTVEKNPGAVVTEYAWSTDFSSQGGNASCDPCPANPPGQSEILSLGADVLPSTKKETWDIAKGVGATAVYTIPTKVMTRLHIRYGKETLGEDLIFKKADPITGGREQTNAEGKLENASVKSTENFFQARYAIRHLWAGEIKCANPVRGMWGGPPYGVATGGVVSAKDLAFAPRGKVTLQETVYKDIPEIDVKTKIKVETKVEKKEEKKPEKKEEKKPSKRKTFKKTKKTAALESAEEGTTGSKWSGYHIPLVLGGFFLGAALIVSRRNK